MLEHGDLKGLNIFFEVLHLEVFMGDKSACWISAFERTFEERDCLGGVLLSEIS